MAKLKPIYSAEGIAEEYEIIKLLDGLYSFFEVSEPANFQRKLAGSPRKLHK